MQKASTSLLFQMAQVKIKKKNVNTLLHITDDRQDLSTSNTAFDTQSGHVQNIAKKTKTKTNVSRGIKGKTRENKTYIILSTLLM